MTEEETQEALQAWRTGQASREVVEQAIDALNRQDFDLYFACFAEGFTFHMPGSTPVSGSTRGLEEFTALVGKVAERVEGMIRLEVTNLVVAGEWVVTESRGRSTTTTGQPYHNTYCHLWRVVGGRIVHFVEYNDTDLVNRILFGDR
jgi:ketosteroid isomerase-like protein